VGLFLFLLCVLCTGSWPAAFPWVRWVVGLRGFCRVFLGGAQPQFLSLMKLLVVRVKMVGLWLYKTKGERAGWGL
jgi:hypothetical protein